MIQATLSKCAICGSATGDKGFCETCGTILMDGKVACEACGTSLQRFAFQCGFCGKKQGEEEKEISPERKETIENLMLVPGMTRETASELYDEGVKDFASLVGQSLTETQRRTGLHQKIARRIMMMDVVDGEHRVEVSEKLECPICESLMDVSAEKCQVCGHVARPSVKDNDILHTPVFKNMPEDFQEELSKVLIEMDYALLEADDEEDANEWDGVYSDLDELESSGEIEQPEEVPQPQETVLICPICEVEVVQDAHFCHNCGARFEEA